MSNLRICFFVALALLLTDDGASDQARAWAWFRSASTGTAWWITEGEATVTMSENKFEALLYDKTDSAFLRLTIRGQTAKGTITARVRVEESDAPEFDVSGRLKRICWPKKGGREVLLLHSGAEVIGLVRELSPSSACTPA